MSSKKGAKAPAKAPLNSLPSEEEQKKVLEEAKATLNREAFFMKRCLDNKKLMEALKHASSMISELRTSLLSPKNYYELYMQAFDQLRHLESFLSEEKQRGKKMSELYEVVQYAGNILPRLYLLITVGSIYIKTKEAPAKDVLRDLVEMCRGVQHPTRGLFLRNYLSEMTKDKLPDIGSDYTGPGGEVTDSISFVLQNFTEMNKLWVRMQHQGPIRDKSRREQERRELRLLVGKNLARLSQLDGVDVGIYKETVLPRIIEQVINCRDQIAQQYLMEIIIQIFPDNFHLQTLEPFLETCAKLQASVDVKSIVVSMLDRLANFATQEPTNFPRDIDVFKIFSSAITNIVEQRPKMSAEDMLALYVSLLNLSLKVYPDKLDYIDLVYNNATALLTKLKKDEVDYSNKECVKSLQSLLNIPLSIYNNVLVLLKLENYTSIIPHLGYANRRKIALDIINNVISNETRIPDADDVAKLFVATQPLLKDEEDQTEIDPEDFEEDQNQVASLIHLFHNDNPEKLFLIYMTARKVFGQGGMKRIRFTLPPLVFRSLHLAARLHARASSDEEWNKVGKRVFKFAHETVTALARTDHKQLAMRLFLQCAEAASRAGFETIAYEFLTQVYEIYESEIAESKAQFRAITEIIGTLQTMRVFGEENYDALSTKTAVHSAKLLKKHDQCRAVYMCSHLFWKPGGEGEGYKEGKRVLECLQKSLRIADACMDSSMNVKLFVEILSEYLYYFEAKNEAVATKYLTGLIALIKTNLGNVEAGEGSSEGNAEAEQANVYFNNTLEHIKLKKKGPNAAAFADIEL